MPPAFGGCSALLGGPTATFDEFVAGRARGAEEAQRRLDRRRISVELACRSEQPAALKKGFRVVQDILNNDLAGKADIVLPAAAWAEKDGSWENFAGKIQAIRSRGSAARRQRREGDVYYKLLGGRACTTPRSCGRKWASRLRREVAQRRRRGAGV